MKIKPNTLSVWFHLSEVSKIVTFPETESPWWLPRDWGEGAMRGCLMGRASVLQHENDICY